MERKPIKRSKYLVELSKDHHVSLLFCWKIREGLKKGVALPRICAYISFFWEQHLKEHFKEEEELLFNHTQHPLCQQGKAEHLLLFEQLNRLTHNERAAKEKYILFEELLNKHIRFEERVLFPSLENLLPVSVLENACELLVLKHSAPYQDNYTDEFWAKTNDK
jgi:hemerythrin-like domain-containing protein